MIILWDNYIDDSTLTSSSVSLSKPLDNIKKPTLSEYFQFNDNNGNITIDLGSAKLITDFIVAGTNISIGYGVLTLEGNDTNNFTSPSYTTSLTRYSNGYIGTKDINETYRYWRLVVSDFTLTKLHLGYMYIGDRLQMPGINPEVSLSYNNKTERSFSQSQQVYSDIGVDYFTSDFTFPIISDNVITIDGKEIATREDILEMWYTNKGAIPLIMIIFDNDRSRIPPLVGILDQNSLDFEFDRTQGYYKMRLNFVETK